MEADWNKCPNRQECVLIYKAKLRLMTDMLSNLSGPTVPSLMCCVCVFECEHCLGLFFSLSPCVYMRKYERVCAANRRELSVGGK